jgi:hypothetical protein
VCSSDLDLGCDERGNIWFFEANAKPMKFDEPEIRKLSLNRIFQYGRFLMHSKALHVASAPAGRRPSGIRRRRRRAGGARRML